MGRIGGITHGNNKPCWPAADCGVTAGGPVVGSMSRVEGFDELLAARELPATSSARSGSRSPTGAAGPRGAAGGRWSNSGRVVRFRALVGGPVARRVTKTPEAFLLRQGYGGQAAAPGVQPRVRVYSVSPSNGAPRTSLGRRKGLPVKRRMLAPSTSRSAIATACAGLGRNVPHCRNGRFVTTIVDRCW